METLRAASAVLGLVNNARNAFQIVQDRLRDAAERSSKDERASARGAEMLARMMCLRVPFFTALELHNRQETINVVGAAVWFTRRVMAKFDDVLVELEDAAAAGPKAIKDEDESSARASELLFGQRSEELVRDLQTSVNLLNLALTTATLMLGRWDPARPVERSKESIQLATHMRARFLASSSRQLVVASGELFEWLPSSVQRRPGKRAHDLRSLGSCRVEIVRCNEADETFQLDLVVDANEAESAPGSDSGSSSGETHTLALNDQFRARRFKKGDIDNGVLVGGEVLDSDVEFHQVAYELAGSQPAAEDDAGEGSAAQRKKLYLVFSAVPGISCQTFEELLSEFRPESSAGASLLETPEDDVSNLTRLLEQQALQTP